MNLSSRIMSLLVVLAFTIAQTGASPDPVTDNWHADLQIPTGTLSLIFVIAEDDDGKMIAHMESPDQAPGQHIPISEISIVDDHLSIKIGIIGASIDADWDNEQNYWEGTFSQGIELPIIIKRGLPANKPIIEGLDGDWKATINRNGVDLRLILHIRTTDSGTSATIDSPDTMANNISMSDLTKDGDQVGYKIAIIDGVFKGTLTDPNTLVGTWDVEGEETLTVTYTRTDEVIKRNRPQVPTEPYGYQVEEITYKNTRADDVSLSGTLTYPDGEGPFPAAILISGSGPQDRDETVFGHQPFLVLADHLTMQGIAVLRYDDRGVGESTGDYSNANSADFATDANAAFEYLLTRSDIDHDSIGFIGHSEGGLIAPLAITDPKLGANADQPIAYMVMLAGPGTSAMQISSSQRRLIAQSQGVTEEDLNKSDAINKAIVHAAANATSTQDAKDKIRTVLTPDAMEILGINELQAQNVIAQNSSPWIRYFLGYDPADYLPQIEIPILALNGELDLQVPAPENLAGLRTLLKDNPDTTIIELESLNHMFQHAKTGAMGEYNDIEETFSPQAMKMISEWINQRFGTE
tara:strand:- start:730437 stop:732176 length:1740 start_codon:yes stop_codon:yes gene_type:complete